MSILGFCYMGVTIIVAAEVLSVSMANNSTRSYTAILPADLEAHLANMRMEMGVGGGPSGNSTKQ